jgi:hypothetical protein
MRLLNANHSREIIRSHIFKNKFSITSKWVACFHLSFAIQMSDELMVACVVSKTPPQHKHSVLRKIMCES